MEPTEEERLSVESEEDSELIDGTDTPRRIGNSVIEENKYSKNKNSLRIVKKSGICNMKKKHRTTRISHFAKDIFTCMVECKWRNILLMLSLSFITSWFLFALLWWVIAYAHGDLAISPYKNEREPCVTLMHNLVSAFLFSMESQYTTGYGNRSPTTECPEAVFLLVVQCIFGILFQSIMIGFVFTKICRPKGRIQAILFSEKAVICVRDGILCFIFRLGDERKSHVINCKIHAWLLQHHITKEGDIALNHQKKLKISVDEGGSELFLLWPVTVVHRIDKNSPLYEMSAKQLYISKIEVVVSLVCTAETTGRPTEVRCSYKANEILWGRRFQSLFTKCNDGWIADYAFFNNTEPVETMPCSAKELNDKITA